MKIYRTILTAAAAAGFVVGSLYAQGANPSLSPDDRRFIMKSAQDNMFEIEAGQTAKNKSTNDDVRAFGDRMATDHGKIHDDLKQLTGKWNVTLPAEVSQKHKVHLTRLKNLSAEQFDAQYMDLMVKGHQQDVALFEKCAASCQNAELKSFASRYAATLQDHLKQAHDIHMKIQKRTQGGSKRAALP